MPQVLQTGHLACEKGVTKDEAVRKMRPPSDVHPRAGRNRVRHTASVHVLRWQLQPAYARTCVDARLATCPNDKVDRPRQGSPGRQGHHCRCTLVGDDAGGMASCGSNGSVGMADPLTREMIEIRGLPIRVGEEYAAAKPLPFTTSDALAGLVAGQASSCGRSRRGDDRKGVWGVSSGCHVGTVRRPCRDGNGPGAGCG